MSLSVPPVQLHASPMPGSVMARRIVTMTLMRLQTYAVSFKIRSPTRAETDTFYCLEAPLASWGFQTVKCISFCTEGTS